MISRLTLSGSILAMGLLLCSTVEAKAEYCEDNPIFCQILDNSPNLDKNYAYELSNVIYRASKKYNINKHLLSAILMQESSYKLNANNNNLDLGIAQINVNTAKSLKLNNKKLMTDLKYSVEAGASVLKWFQKTYKKREPDTWYCRYNVGSRKNANESKACAAYIKAVNRWL